MKTATDTNDTSSMEWFVTYQDVGWGGVEAESKTRWFESEIEASEFMFHVILCGADDWELGRVTAGLKAVVPISDCDQCGVSVPPALLRKSVIDGKPAELCPGCNGPTAEDIANDEAEESDKTERRLVYHATPDDPFGVAGVRGHENITADLVDALQG